MEGGSSCLTKGPLVRKYPTCTWESRWVYIIRGDDGDSGEEGAYLGEQSLANNLAIWERTRLTEEKDPIEIDGQKVIIMAKNLLFNK